MKRLKHFSLPVFLLLFLAFISAGAFAQSASNQKEERRERNIDEIRVEAIHRAEVGQYPLIGLDPGDVTEAFGSIHTSDKDEWAAGFMHVADRYFNEAKSLEKSDPTKANADYIRAWRLYSFGRWPIPASPGKQHSYEKAIEAFLAHARFFDPPLEVVRIPFEGKEIIGYLRLPKNAKGPVPLVVAVNGLDSRKEDLTESFSAILPFGIGYLAVDGPGTGQNPIKVSETADRMLSRVLDYAQSRPEIDKNRISHAVACTGLRAVASGDRQEPHCDARRELGSLLGDENGDRRAGAAARVQRTVSAGRQLLSERVSDELAAGQSRVLVRSGACAHEHP